MKKAPFDYFIKATQEAALRNDGLKVSFGALVNDPQRLNMVLRQSEFPKDTICHIINNPDSVTKGLNKLLDIIEGEEAEFIT